MDDILNYKQLEEEDYYSILGCSESSTIQQIIAEYKVRAMQLHPDKAQASEDTLNEFQKLQTAKNVLSDEKMRHEYDQWRNSKISMSFKSWMAFRERSHMSMHWSAPKDKLLRLHDGLHGETQEQKQAADMRLLDESHTPDNDVLRRFRNYEI